MTIQPNSKSELPDSAWTGELANAIAASLREFAPRLDGCAIAMLEVVCLPWHGLLSLAILTSDELASDARLADPRTTMEWQHGEFTEEVEAWDATTPLANKMRAAYEDAIDRAAAAEAFLNTCADAASTVEVNEALKIFQRADCFRVSVPHPDNGREFFSPRSNAMSQGS